MTPEEVLDLAARWIGARLTLIEFLGDQEWAKTPQPEASRRYRKLRRAVDEAELALFEAGLLRPLTEPPVKL